MTISRDCLNSEEFHQKRSNAKIDKLVYALYGLTDDEIKIVEEGT